MKALKLTAIAVVVAGVVWLLWSLMDSASWREHLIEADRKFVDRLVSEAKDDSPYNRELLPGPDFIRALIEDGLCVGYYEQRLGPVSFPSKRRKHLEANLCNLEKQSHESLRKELLEWREGEKAAQLFDQHPDWRLSDISNVVRGKIDVGMLSEQIEEAWGSPDRKVVTDEYHIWWYWRGLKMADVLAFNPVALFWYRLDR